MNEEFRIRVRELRQTTSARDYVVIFDAHILILPDDRSIEVRLVDDVVGSPPELEHAEDELRVRAIKCIQQGVESVLQPRDIGAIVEVSNLTVNLVDFIDTKFTDFTVAYLEAGLAADGG